METQRYFRYALSIALTVLFLLQVGGMVRIGVLDKLENLAYDTRLKLTLPAISDKQVFIVDIDEKSLSEIGQWPWNRDILAEITDTLHDYYGVKALGFDIVFAEADEDEGAKILKSMASGVLKDTPEFIDAYRQVVPKLQRDETFAKSLSERKTVMGYFFGPDVKKGRLPEPVAHLDKAVSGKIAFIKAQGYAGNLDLLQKEAFSGGFFSNPLLDDDGVFRRVPLLQEYDGNLYESLALALTRSVMGSPRVELVVETSDESRKQLFLEWVKIGDVLIPVDEHAGVLVPYIGSEGSFSYISAVDIYKRKIPAKQLKEQIAIFGTSAAGLRDLRTTPLESAYSGVEIHANIIQGILDQRIMHKPEYTKGYEFLLLALIGIILTLLLPVVSPLWGTIASLSLLPFLAVGNLLVWQKMQLVLPVASSLLLTMLLFALHMTYGFFVETRGKRQLTHLFGQYVPPELVDEMSKDMMGDISLDGEMRNMSVLFTDVRSFTTISENMEPKELTKFINAFLTPITHIIHDQRGTIDKYMGDAVMAFWNAPIADDQHALHALTAAVEMTRMIKDLSKEFETRGWPPINIGVGINTGEMNVGNKGSEFRVDYTIIGDPVNLGSRLEGLTKIYGVDVITSEYTRHAVPEFEYRELDRVKVKGKDNTVVIYEPLGLLENIEREVRKDIKRFHMGLKMYRAQKWDDAEREIFSLHSQDKERKIYQIYLDRIIAFRNNPPPENWDGSFTHVSK